MDTLDNTKAEIVEKIDLVGDFISSVRAFMPKFLFGVVVFLIGYIIAIKIRKIFKRIMKKSSADTTVVGFFSQVLFFTIIIIVSIVALGIIGIPTSSFITTLGAFGIAIGLALQNNLSNFASGIIILMFRPFKAGDFIETKDGAAGTVYSINTMNTSLDTTDNKRIYIPNSILTTNHVINYSQNSTRTMILNTKITYKSDHNKAIHIIREILTNCEHIQNKESILCEINDLNIHFVNIISKSIVNTDDYFLAYYYVLKTIKDEFDKNNIEFANSKNIATF